jgi:hypothetical protein
MVTFYVNPRSVRSCHPASLASEPTLVVTFLDRVEHDRLNRLRDVLVTETIPLQNLI